MSSQNAYPGPSAGRPAARPANQERPRQPAWVQPQAQPGQIPSAQAPYPANGWPQQPAPGYQGGFAQPGYGAQQPQPPQQQAAYGQWSELQPAHSGHHGGQPGPAGHADPYAPQFEPYVPPAYGAQPAPQWPGRGADPRGFDVGGYAAPGHAPQAVPQPAQHGAAAYGDRQYHEAGLSAADWAGEPGGFGHEHFQQGHGGELGFAQPDGGELDAAYGEEDVEYEDEEAPRGRRPIMIAAALIGAILVGGGVAYGYKKFAALGPQGDPPIIKSEAFPSKIKPADAGGKQFPYSDSKIMGRLGDGTSSATDANSATGPASDPSSGASSAPSTDDGGTRKVATLVVGRDGTIQPPAVAPASDPPPSSQVAVPGTSLVDVFGGQGASVPPPAPARNDSISMRPTSRPVTADDTPSLPKKTTIAPVKIAKINGAGSSKAAAATTGSIAERDDAAATAPPPAKKPKKVARAETTTVSDAETDSAPVTSSGGTGGFVAVLASVPRSASSRMDALKRFADMQQKYGSALAGKTPDVADANLGAKGNYHRLIVGPPGSREQASTLCSQLKSQGYNDCWVTSY